MPDKLLHPALQWLIYVLTLLAVVQWGLIGYFAPSLNLIYDLDCWLATPVAQHAACPASATLPIAVKAETQIIPLTADFFFIAWNVFPIAMGATFLYLQRYYFANLPRIMDRLRNRSGNRFEQHKARIRDNLLLVFLLLCLLTYIAVTAQLEKQSQFIIERDFLYWWSIEISPAVFYIRLFFVVTNIILIALVLWASYWVLWSLFAITRKAEIEPFVLDPLKRFGMQAYGVLQMLAITPWFLALVIAILGWIDHQGRQGVANVFGNLLLGGIALFGLFLIAVPLMRVTSRLEVIRQRLITSLDQENSKLEASLRSAAHADGSDLKLDSVREAPAFLVHQHIVSSSSWPLPGTFGIPTLISLVSPFLGAFGISATTAIELLIRALELRAF